MMFAVVEIGLPVTSASLKATLTLAPINFDKRSKLYFFRLQQINTIGKESMLR